MEYTVTRTGDLEHSLLGHMRGDYGSKKEKANHKYIARIDTPYGWRYFYDQKELDAYYNNLRKEVNKVQAAYDDSKDDLKVLIHRKGKPNDYYVRLSKMSDSDKKQHADDIAKAQEKQEARKAYIEKYGGQLSEYDKSKTVAHSEFLEHHGILGQKWGVRRYQNYDGTLTEAGKRRIVKDSKRLERKQDKAEKAQIKYANELDKFNRLNNKRFFRNENRVSKASSKLSRSNSKFSRKLNKANKFYRKMEKRYGKELVTNLDQTLIKKGEMFITSAMSAGVMASSTNAINYNM